jgi:hypothetical protein
MPIKTNNGSYLSVWLLFGLLHGFYKAIGVHDGYCWNGERIVNEWWTCHLTRKIHTFREHHSKWTMKKASLHFSPANGSPVASKKELAFPQQVLPCTHSNARFP